MLTHPEIAKTAQAMARFLTEIERYLQEAQQRIRSRDLRSTGAWAEQAPQRPRRKL